MGLRTVTLKLDNAEDDWLPFTLQMKLNLTRKQLKLNQLTLQDVRDANVDNPTDMANNEHSILKGTCKDLASLLVYSVGYMLMLF